jgi:class 3 adenylate cyclase
MLHIGKVHLRCKVAIHYCEEVYNITFFKGYNDYYGKDIDLTVRLLSKAKENKIVISEPFYQKVLQDLKNQGMAQDSEYMKYKYIEDFKGVPYSTPFRLLNI